jgi:hypothetical protein
MRRLHGVWNVAGLQLDHFFGGEGAGDNLRVPLALSTSIQVDDGGGRIAGYLQKVMHVPEILRPEGAPDRTS